MVVRDNDGKPSDIMCDGNGCNELAPDVATIMAGGGLIKMGWQCSGGTHYCPPCVEAGNTGSPAC